MSKKILVVDDDDDIVLLLKRFLEKNGCEIIEACSGEECLQKINEFTPDLIILDIIMPDMNGWDVCKKIKENGNTRSIPVSMLSSRKSHDDIEKSFKYAHADEHLTKPIDFSKLSEMVGRFI